MTERHAIGVPADLDPELSAAAQLIGGARDVTLVAHVYPDVDALWHAATHRIRTVTRGWAMDGGP